MSNNKSSNLTWLEDVGVKARIILHIGTEKTGTTSVQRALAFDRKSLSSRGFLYPRIFGSENHMEIAVAAMNTNPLDELQMIELERHACNHEEYRELVKQRLSEEYSSSSFHTIIISNEHCHSRIKTSEELYRLFDIIGVRDNNVELIVYLRRQDRVAVSLYSTKLKLGGNSVIFPEIYQETLPRYFCYDEMLGLYETVVGRDHMKVRLYERDRLLGKEVVSDFYEIAKLGENVPKLVEANVSMSQEQAKFLVGFNKRFPLIRDGKLNKERGPIYAAIKSTCNGLPFRPPRAQAEAFYSAFLERNARIRTAYFADLDRESLFDQNFSEYPVKETGGTLSDEEMFEFISAIWRYWQVRG